MVALKEARLSSAAGLIDAVPAFGHPTQHIVVMHHGLAIRPPLQVALDAVAGGDRRAIADELFSMMPAGICNPRWAMGRAVSQARPDIG